ncbi:MAG TPA: GNAT family N-acetyltransferase [Dongiaceae bacterium]|nr:GNAT family N-acetyltransferase [Dongiaceae bacterium]
MPGARSCAIVTPTLERLPEYRQALERGWSPDNVNPEKTAQAHLAAIAQDAAAFVAGLTDIEAKGAPIAMPDGTTRPRLPGRFLWVWDGAFCGSFSLRWVNGTSELPDYCLGHIGYSIVPWKRRRGYATAALALVLDEARKVGLDSVQLTTDLKNEPSQKVILANGGRLMGPRRKYSAYGDAEELLWRIDL